MQTWAEIFIVIAALAILLQTLLLIAFYIQFRRLAAVFHRLAQVVDTRVTPVLSRIERLLEESHEQIRDIVRDAADIMRAIKTNGQRFDRLLEEATDRLRLQIIRADRLLTGALEAAEDAGAGLEKSVMGPVRTGIALIRGVRAGIDVLRGRSRTPERRRETEDEGLFI